MSRIITAREQVEMLSPWHESAAVNDWERKKITKNDATDINGDSHKLTWNGSRGGYANGERSSGMSPECSCGESAGSGHSEASGRRWFTDHIKGIEHKG